MTDASTASPLPVLPFWQARSFWLTALAAVSTVLSALTPVAPWLARVLPLVQDPATVDAILAVVGGVAAVLAWRERLKPRFQLGA